MKTNKEFIEGIYEKADEISNEKNRKKKNSITKIGNIAAILIIGLALGININASKMQKYDYVEDISKEENTISLKTVDTFANFCSIIKNVRNLNGNYNNFLEDAGTDLAAGAKPSYSEIKEESKTNNQVKNVEEADIVKVDENYIYYIADKKIVIIDAKDGENSTKVAEIQYTEKEYLNEMYVNKNKLIVIISEYSVSSTGTYAIYDVLYTQDKSKTSIVIYDVSNKREPKEIRRVEVDGNYISSRMIKNNIYFVTTKNIYNSEIENNEIETLNEEVYKPKYKDTIISEEEKCIDYNSIYCFDEIETTNYLMIGGINLERNEEVEIQTFLGAGSYTYSSEKNMYIAKNKIEYNDKYEYIGSSTHIFKFALNNGKVKFEAEANVEGQINNQFSMDENGEYFRIASTVGKSWETTEETNNNLYILNEKLELVGSVTGFAVGERIYSVRYVDNKAYVVTFKQTDPLFVIDLSEPTNPQILGELKIPGYSTYLHPYDETHIIGFGYETKEDGTRITTNGLKMVMFDVSDVTNPKEVFKIAIGDKYTSSELIYNHKALLYSKEKNIIAFPLNAYTKNKNYTKAAIYEIDLEKGFLLKGEIQHEYINYTRRIERIVYANSAYYTLSKSLIKVTNMDTLNEIKQIEI